MSIEKKWNEMRSSIAEDFKSFLKKFNDDFQGHLKRSNQTKPTIHTRIIQPILISDKDVRSNAILISRIAQVSMLFYSFCSVFYMVKSANMIAFTFNTIQALVSTEVALISNNFAKLLDADTISRNLSALSADTFTILVTENTLISKNFQREISSILNTSTDYKTI